MSLFFVNIVSIAILLAFAVRTIRNTLYYLFLWQNKEYRLDRMLVHLRTIQGHQLLFGAFSVLKLAILIIFSVAVIYELSLLASISIWLFGGLIVIESIKNLKEIYTRAVPFPVFSLKIIIIFLATLFLQTIFIITSSARLALDYLPFLDKSLALMVALQIGFFSIPARIYSSIKQMLAKEKIARMTKLKVVGITGSYGKTSTKEFTAQLLEQKYKVVKTQANDNTAIGVANAILQNIDNTTDIFVMEAAAYKRGEIRAIANMVQGKLEYAVITGLNTQHLDLFKSADNIAATKYELVEMLNKNGTAIFNANNIQTKKMAQKAKKSGRKVKLYGYNKRYYANASQIKQTPKRVSFTLTLDKRKNIATAPLLGKHNVENILAAVTVAHQVGLPWGKILAGIRKLKTTSQTMEYISRGKNIFIDDTYNANPNGAIAALDYLSVYNTKRILVLQPLIELGASADKAHTEIGEKAADVCDLIILTNTNFNQAFMEGVSKSKSKTAVLVGSGLLAKELIEEKYKGRKVILFEGKEAERVLKQYV